MKVLLCYGTRPELIKLQPLMKVFEGVIPYKTLCIQQHTDLLNTIGHQPDFIAYPQKTHSRNVGNRLDSIFGSIATFNNQWFQDITHVLVQGDTAAAITAAMAALHRNIPVIHLEAGLRTFDNTDPYPEEVYRKLISQIATIHLCPTAVNANNLKNAGIEQNVFVVGNTVIDGIRETVPDLFWSTTRGIVQKGSKNNNHVLITLHRRENHAKIKEWFQELNQLAINYQSSYLKFVMTLHPNPNIQEHKGLLTNIETMPPMPHEEFIRMLTESYMLISDSGGVQEEAAFFGKPVIVCRKTTERIETLGTSSFLCDVPQKLESLYLQLCNKHVQPSTVYGDGYSSYRIMDILTKLGV